IEYFKGEKTGRRPSFRANVPLSPGEDIQDTSHHGQISEGGHNRLNPSAKRMSVPLSAAIGQSRLSDNDVGYRDDKSLRPHDSLNPYKPVTHLTTSDFSESRLSAATFLTATEGSIMTFATAPERM